MPESGRAVCPTDAALPTLGRPSSVRSEMKNNLGRLLLGDAMNGAHSSYR